MKTTWVLAANRTGARLFRRDGQALTRIRDLPHPEGRVRDQDLEAGRAQRSFDSHARGRYAEEHRTSQHEKTAQAFARELGRFLKDLHFKPDLDRLVLVAEPHFLGLLRAELDATTEAVIAASATKDVGAVPDREVWSHLKDVL